MVIVKIITTYHAVYWRCRASGTDGWFLPCSTPWVPRLPEVAHSMTEDPEDQGYRPTRLWGQRQLQSVSITNGDERWPVGSPEVWGQGIASQQHSNKQIAKALAMGAMQQPRNKAACMRQSKSWPRPGVLPSCPLTFQPLGPRATCSRYRTCKSTWTCSQFSGELQPSVALNLHCPLPRIV